MHTSSPTLLIRLVLLVSTMHLDVKNQSPEPEQLADGSAASPARIVQDLEPSIPITIFSSSTTFPALQTLTACSKHLHLFVSYRSRCSHSRPVNCYLSSSLNRVFAPGSKPDGGPARTSRLATPSSTHSRSLINQRTTLTTLTSSATTCPQSKPFLVAPPHPLLPPSRAHVATLRLSLAY